MKEKIKELAKQAGGRIRNVCYGHGDYVDEFQLSTSKNIELFAELIIKECLSNMENSDGDLDYAIWKTKNDFEVE